MPYVFSKGPAELARRTVSSSAPQDSTRATQVSVQVVYGNAVLLPAHHQLSFVIFSTISVSLSLHIHPSKGCVSVIEKVKGSVVT
jgi:hypothetical protein